jgi:hypothetical protein
MSELRLSPLTSTRLLLGFVHALIAILLLAGPTGSARALDTAAVRLIETRAKAPETPSQRAAVQAAVLLEAFDGQDADGDMPVGAGARSDFSPRFLGGARMGLPWSTAPPHTTRRSSAPPTGPPPSL